MFMRINTINLKDGKLEEQKQEVIDFAKNNDPEKTGLIGNILAIDRDGGPTVAITIWRDEAAFEASSKRWPDVMKSMEDMYEDDYSRREFEIVTTSLPIS